MFFKSKDKIDSKVESVTDAIAKVDVQINKEKKERAAVVKENEEARDHAKDVLKENGFTLTLFLAAHNPKGAGR